MSLDLGTLRGFLELDDTKFDQGLDTAGDKLEDFGKTAAAAAAKAGDRAGIELANGWTRGADGRLRNAQGRFVSAGEAAAEGLGEGFDGTAKKWAVGAGLAIGGALMASLVKGMNIEAANDKLAAQLNLSAEESARAGKNAGELYAANYGESLDQVNEAIKGVIQNVDGMRKASDADLQAVTKGVLNLASTFDQDLGMTTAAVGQMIRTGMVKDAKEALDVLTVGMQGPANKADDLMETFNEYGTQFRKLGLSGKDAMGLLSQGLKGGARDADIVADSLKEFAIRSQEALETTNAQGQVNTTPLGDALKNVIGPTRDMYDIQKKIAAGGPGARKALDIVLDGLRNMKNPADQAKTAVALFGTQAEDMGAALYDLDPTTATDALGKVGGAAEKMDKVLNDNAISSLASLKRQAEMAFGSLMNFALPIVNELAAGLSENFGPALAKVVDIGGDVVGFFTKHKTAAKALAVVIAALVVVTQAHAAVLAVTAAGGLASFIKQLPIITTLTKTWTAVQWAMNAALTANPLGLIVVAIGALVVALVIAYKKSETFRDVVKGVVDGVASAWRWLWNSILQPVFQKLVEGIAWIMDKFGDMLDAMSHVPGFGWAKTAADAMHGAADKARELADNIKKIPPKKDVFVTYHETTIRSVQDHQANNPKINPHGATGGIVTAPTWALIGEAGPEMVVPLDRTPGSSPLPRGGGVATAERTAPLIGQLTVPAMPGSTEADVHRVVSAVVYEVGLAARSGRWS